MQNSTRDFRYTAIHNSTQFHTIPGMYIHIKWTNVGNDCRADVIKTSALSQFPWSPRTPAGGFVRSMSASTYQAPFDAALGQQEMERTFCHLAALHGANQKSGFIHRLHSPTPTAIFSRHVVQNSLKYCRNVHPNCHTLPTASAVWMFCCADIQTTNKRRGMQQDLRCSIPSQLHCVNKTKHTSGQGSQWSRGRLRTWSGTPPSVGWAMSAKVYCLASTFDSTLPKLGRVTTRSEGLKGIVHGPMLVQHSISDSSPISLAVRSLEIPALLVLHSPSYRSCPRVATSPSMDWHISISDWWQLRPWSKSPPTSVRYHCYLKDLRSLRATRRAKV